MQCRSLTILASLSIGLLACTSATTTTGPTTTAPRLAPPPTNGTTDPRGTAATSTIPAAGKGWINGEPAWSGGLADSSAGAAVGGDVMTASAATAAAGSRVASPDGAVEASGSATDAAKPGTPAGAPSAEPRAQAAASTLRAGSVDDNADFAGYLEYLKRYQQLGVPERPFDPTGRIVISIHGANGLPAKGVAVAVTVSGAPVAELRTDATGRAIFLPATYGAIQASYHIAAGEASSDATPGTDVTLGIAANGGEDAGMPVDILFLLDVTGSMGDEINQLKTTIADVSSRLEQLTQHPDIRFGMTLFRDQGDAFVTSTFDFTGDLQRFRTALNDVAADGGGDTPEAVEEGFASALAEPSWRDPATAVQMVFLVGDAAPHIERQLDQTYPQSIHLAAERGVTVNVIAASATDDPAEHAFRAIAEGTGGRFVFLAYGAGGAALGEHSDINATDYEELSLDDLVVRLVSEQLAALTGAPTTPPPTIPVPDSTPTVPPTNPPGQ